MLPREIEGLTLLRSNIPMKEQAIDLFFQILTGDLQKLVFVYGGEPFIVAENTLTVGGYKPGIWQLLNSQRGSGIYLDSFFSAEYLQDLWFEQVSKWIEYKQRMQTQLGREIDISFYVR